MDNFTKIDALVFAQNEFHLDPETFISMGVETGVLFFMQWEHFLPYEADLTNLYNETFGL